MLKPSLITLVFLVHMPDREYKIPAVFVRVYSLQGFYFNQSFHSLH